MAITRSEILVKMIAETINREIDDYDEGGYDSGRVADIANCIMALTELRVRGEIIDIELEKYPNPPYDED